MFTVQQFRDLVSLETPYIKLSREQALDLLKQFDIDNEFSRTNDYMNQGTE